MITKTHTSPLRILAADIGGTQARFAEVRVDGRAWPEPAAELPPAVKPTIEPVIQLGPAFSMDTRQNGVGSFREFFEAFRKKAPSELADTHLYDGISLALAGAVGKDSAVLTNIDWDITPDEARAFPNLFMLNDFLAQGYALASPDAFSRLDSVRPGEASLPGVLAMVGAGTGLGHCALIAKRDAIAGGNPGWRVLGSEAGHASFAFHGEAEHAIEREWLKRTGKTSLSNDDVVSGSGAVQLHAALTTRMVSAAEALGGKHPQTVEWFSRFYGRACRNYCLAVYPVQALIVSGGIALRHPHLVRSETFLDAFNDAGDYTDLLARIPIWLNTDPHIGIRGAALYAAGALASHATMKTNAPQP